MIRRKAGAGAMSTKCCSICRREKLHTTDRYRATTDPLSTKNEEISHAMRAEKATRHRFRHVLGTIGRIDPFERFVRAISGKICASEQICRNQRRQTALSGCRQGRSRRAAAWLCRNQPYVAAADRKTFRQAYRDRT